MKNTKGFLLLLVCLFMGNLISYFLPIKIPGSIVGMILMLIFLSYGIIKIDQVEGISQILIAHMVLIFLPGIVNLITIYPTIAPHILKLFFIILVSTIMVIAATGFTVEKLILFMEEKKNV